MDGKAAHARANALAESGDSMMRSAEWWAKAQTTPGDAPSVVDGVFHAGTIWTMSWGKHTAKAEVWGVPNVGMDLRVFIDANSTPPSSIAA